MRGITWSESASIKNAVLELMRVERGTLIDEGVPAVDLLHCLRKAYFRRSDPTESTDRWLIDLATSGRPGPLLDGLGKQWEDKGVIFHADAVLRVGGWETPVLVKPTRMSVRTDLAKTGYWVAELAGCCYASGSSAGYIVGIYLRGDYTGHIEPQCRGYKVEFDSHYLITVGEEMNWRLLRLQSALHDNIPPKIYDEMWECKGCSARDLCEQMPDGPWSRDGVGIKGLEEGTQ